MMKAEDSDLISRARGEYMEMPGLSLTLRQAQRLWGLELSTCRQVLQGLIDSGFLKRRSDGSYVRCASGGIDFERIAESAYQQPGEN